MKPGGKQIFQGPFRPLLLKLSRGKFPDSVPEIALICSCEAIAKEWKFNNFYNCNEVFLFQIKRSQEAHSGST